MRIFQSCLKYDKQCLGYVKLFLDQIMVIIRPQNIFTCPVHCFRLLGQLGKSSKNIIFWSNSLTISFGVQIYQFFGYFYVWKNFRGSRGATRRASIIKPILKMCSQTSNYPRRNISRVKNMLFLRFTKKCTLVLFLGGAKKTFPNVVPQSGTQYLYLILKDNILG